MRFAILSQAIFLAIIASIAAAEPPAYRQVDERRAGQLGIRKIVGRHLRLYTDLPASNAVDELPVVFDAAVEQWADYFGIAPQQVARWKMQGFLIQDRAKFAALKLLPETHSDFKNGYTQGLELWLHEQPSDYYRRHLLLHEGTHGFMYAHLGGTGPGWYSEGMAELLGTHHWKNAQLQLGVMPTDREEVPMWGRIKLIREASRAGQSLSLQAVLGLGQRRALTTDQYAWCWGLCNFLDSHPQWQPKFRQLHQHVADPKFNQRFLAMFEDTQLEHEWNAFVATLDYGYDAKRMAIVQRDFGDAATENIAADRGWQEVTGWQLQAGKEYRITAEGSFQIAKTPEPWPCEPGGITLEYHEGRPLGMLLGAFCYANGDTFSEPIDIGLGQTIKPKKNAQLYLRVNDSPARLSDNKGTLRVSLAPSP
ncbi:MAG: hypothetical protein GXP28_10345 [Planctomycetes bacterium]|nr:hypothetical protein [Planctomycetota bacterium]